MRVILVCGSRGWDDFNLIDYLLAAYVKPGDIIRHGACPTGADEMAAAWCDQNGYAQDPMPAEWDRYGRQAGPIRNAAMAAKKPAPIVVLAFMLGKEWGASPGTANMLKQVDGTFPVVVVQKR